MKATVHFGSESASGHGSERRQQATALSHFGKLGGKRWLGIGLLVLLVSLSGGAGWLGTVATVAAARAEGEQPASAQAGQATSAPGHQTTSARGEQAIGAQAAHPPDSEDEEAANTSVEDSAEMDCDPDNVICIDVFEDDPEAITARWDGSERVWIVEPPTGYVQIRHKGDMITARRMRLQEENEYAYLEEDVFVWREDARVRSHALDLWWEREEFIFTGDVVLVQLEDAEEAQPAEPELADTADAETPAEPSRQEVRTVWAQRVEYDGASGDVVAQQDVRMEDDNYRVWAQEMVYREEAEEMLFNDQVRVISGEDDWTMTGQRFFYDLAADEGRLIGPHRIELTPRD